MLRLLGDIASPRLLVLKGGLFVVLGLLASVALVASAAASLPMRWTTVLFLHAVAVWAFCRVYYFAFYVIEKYIDPGARYSGLWNAFRFAISIARDGRRPRS